MGNVRIAWGMATIEKRINSRGHTSFRVRIRIHGNPKETATFAKISDAKLWALQTEAAIHERRYFKTAESNRHTLTELITRYQKDILPYKSTSMRFIAGQHNQLNWWKTQLGDYYLSDITPPRIVEARSNLKIKPSSVNRYMAALSHVFTVAVREWEWVEKSPISKIAKLKEPRGRVRFLSDEERNKLLDAAHRSGNKPLHLAIILALSTGARKGELLNLCWKDVDFERRRLIFHDTKNGERRNAALGDYALQMAQRYFDSQLLPTNYVFSSRRNTPLRIDSDFRALLYQVGIEDFRFHDLRHSAASYLAMNGASMTDIAEVLGHKTLSMVKRYTHLSESHTAQVVTRMNSAIFPELYVITEENII